MKKLPTEGERGYQSIINKNPNQTINRILIGTPTTGLVRIEWVQGRYGQIIPTNWSNVQMIQWINAYMPLNYTVPEAQNLIVKACLQHNFEWLFLLESDNVLQPDAFIRLNEYMRQGTIPIVSGLYFTKSEPPEPLIYRGRGSSFYHEWRMGDRVWCDGVPTGCLLIHSSILKAMWDESPEYLVGAELTRRVFNIPERIYHDPITGALATEVGTSDLEWCRRVIKGRYFEKAGWPKYQKMKYPFLVDTNIFVWHIDEKGRKYPLKDPKYYGY